MEHQFLYFYYFNQNILLKESRAFNLSCRKEQFIELIPKKQDLMKTNEWYPFFSWDKIPCMAASIENSEDIPDGYQLIPLRAVLKLYNQEIIHIVSKGSGLTFWNQTTKYCGRCGHLTEKIPEDNGKKCEKCGSLFYPRIAPAIIVRIEKGESLLLAQDIRFVPTNLYSNIAGFVEPGETLEQAVEREIMEEIGIRVKNIKYFASQHWPISQSLMIAFTAVYAGGDVLPDGKEIISADWFTKKTLPVIPEPGSISNTLIEDFFKEK